MLQAVNRCPNCESIMQDFFIAIDGKPIIYIAQCYMAVLVCPTCHIISMSKERLLELVNKINNKEVKK